MAQRTTLLFDESKSGDNYMEPWVTLREAIPDGQVKAAAMRMNVSYDFVLRWRREPTSDEQPTATGMASPLSRTCNLIDAVFLTNPFGASLIAEHIVLHHQRLVNAHVEGFGGSIEQRAIASADILTQATQAVISLNVEGTEETLRKLVLLRDAADAAISRVGKDLYHDQPPTHT